MAKAYQDGHPIATIAHRLHVSTERIRGILLAQGAPVRASGSGDLLRLTRIEARDLLAAVEGLPGIRAKLELAIKRDG